MIKTIFQSRKLRSESCPGAVIHQVVGPGSLLGPWRAPVDGGGLLSSATYQKSRKQGERGAVEANLTGV